MNRNSIVLLGTLTLAACSRDKAPDTSGSTTTTGAATASPTPGAGDTVTVEEIRTVLIERGPGGEAVSGVMITNDNGVVTLRGKVPDEKAHMKIVDSVRSMPKVKTVRDELQVKK